MATYSGNVELESFEAGADLSAKQFTFLTVNSSGKVVSPSAGAFADGVLFNNPTSGQMASVAMEHGQIVKVVCAGSISAGGNIATDANGKAVAASTSGHIIVAKALEAGAANRVISILFGYRGAVP